jgi:glutamate dehydrogenase (NAD(P)+)
MHREGYRVVSLSDMYGFVHNARGLDVPAVLAHLGSKKRLEGYVEADYEATQPGKLPQLEIDCELLVPAATENQITSLNADRIKARVIVEGANGPTTGVASDILDSRGIIVVPDILANAGGVTVSYFEWVQDRMGYFWEEDDVNKRLETLMRKAFAQVVDRTRKSKVNMRTAAYMEGINRVAYCTKMRGVYP